MFHTFNLANPANLHGKSGPAIESSRKREKVARACERCRSFRTKCGQKPCSRCVADKVKCVVLSLSSPEEQETKSPVLTR